MEQLVRWRFPCFDKPVDISEWILNLNNICNASNEVVNNFYIFIYIT